MRFEPDGPDVPGDLLTARDNGEVVFFCGAGVSKQDAGGPTFWELAERVITDLRPARSSPARRILDLSRNIELPAGVGGFPPADRLFALLEQEFAIADVRAAAAKAVRPQTPGGTGAHRILLDLARAPGGDLRLVTTNFDRLFQSVDPNLRCHLPPSLPDPRRADLWTGLVYLHGRASADYAGADPGDFVLSSADFGRAYMSDGWATTFMRSLIDHYQIVFVGYSADDPPVQYLLEAISRTRVSPKLYAFHPGGAEQAAALWRHKGVVPIPHGDYPALWRSLDAWAAQARDPAAWRASVVATAQKGPREISAYQRGQVAHLVSTLAGAQDFCRVEPPPPADWLCVFDPYVRYIEDARADLMWERSNEGQKVFENYHLDNDPAPVSSGKRNETSVPNGAWSALEALPSDTVFRPGHPVASVRGRIGIAPARLTVRLHQIAAWIGRVAKEPIAVWWAAGQIGLHPDFRQMLTQRLDQSMPEPVRSAWRRILTPTEQHDEDGMEQYGLQRLIQQDGWSPWLVRELAEVQKPYVKVSRPMTGPPLSGDVEGARLISTDVVYPRPIPEIEVPAEFLGDYVKLLRSHLELACELEEETRGYAYLSTRPITPFDDPGSRTHDHMQDLPGLIVRLAQHVERLEGIDPAAAQSAVQSWPGSDNMAFGQLRRWACGRSALMTLAEAEAEISKVTDEQFWDRQTQRDISASLVNRWADLSAETRVAVEARILAGPPRWTSAEPEKFAKYRAFRILNRLHWLETNRLTVTFDLAAERAKLLEIIPDWTGDEGVDENERATSRGGWVATDTTHDMLTDVPLDQLLDEADAVSGRGRDFLVEHRPFQGWVQTHPVRALAALVKSAERGQMQSHFWNDFLWSQQRGQDRPRLKYLIGERLLELPSAVADANLNAMSNWLKLVGEDLFRGYAKTYSRLWDRVASAMVAAHESQTNPVRSSGNDWMTDAINAPAGRLAQLLLDELGWSETKPSEVSENWKRRAESLLAVAGSTSTQACAVFGASLVYLFYLDPQWTDENLVVPAEAAPDAERSRALLSCLLTYSRNSLTSSLFLRLKSLFLQLDEDNPWDILGNHPQRLMFQGWISHDEAGERLVSDEELHEVLLAGGEAGLATTATNAGHWASRENMWPEVIYLMQTVWPKQLIAKSPKVSAALARMALEAGDHIPEVTEAVLPHLSQSNDGWAVPIHLMASNDTLLARFPEQHLAVLWAVLPERPMSWAYGTDGLIGKLAKIEAVANDRRMRELVRRAADP